MCVVGTGGAGPASERCPSLAEAVLLFPQLPNPSRVRTPLETRNPTSTLTVGGPRSGVRQLPRNRSGESEVR